MSVYSFDFQWYYRSCVVAVRIDAVRGRPPTSDMDLIDEGGIISHLCNKLQVDVTDNRVNVSVRVGLNGSDVLVFDGENLYIYIYLYF